MMHAETTPVQVRTVMSIISGLIVCDLGLWLCFARFPCVIGR